MKRSRLAARIAHRLRATAREYSGGGREIIRGGVTFLARPARTVDALRALRDTSDGTLWWHTKDLRVTAAAGRPDTARVAWWGKMFSEADVRDVADALARWARKTRATLTVLALHPHRRRRRR